MQRTASQRSKKITKGRKMGPTMAKILKDNIFRKKKTLSEARVPRITFFLEQKALVLGEASEKEAMRVLMALVKGPSRKGFEGQKENYQLPPYFMWGGGSHLIPPTRGGL